MLHESFYNRALGIAQNAFDITFSSFMDQKRELD